jgi:hypothetical protein
VASDEADRRKSDGNEVEGCNLNVSSRLRDRRTATQPLYSLLKGMEIGQELLKSATELVWLQITRIGMSRREEVIERRFEKCYGVLSQRKAVKCKGPTQVFDSIIRNATAESQ